MTDITGSKILFNEAVISVSNFKKDKYPTAGSTTIYEVIRVEKGVPLFIEDYLERLKNSFALDGSVMSLSNDEIIHSIERLMQVNNCQSGPVKLVFGRDYPAFFLAYLMKPHLPDPGEYVTGVKTILMNETRDNPNVKMWNNDLRKRSVSLEEQAGAYEAILINKEGYITEGSRSNIFFIQNGVVYTPPDEMILPGITRKKVLGILKESDIKVIFKAIKPDELPLYNSCFLTGTTRKVVPVRLIGDREFSVDDQTLRFVADRFEKFVDRYIQNQKRGS